MAIFVIIFIFYFFASLVQGYVAYIFDLFSRFFFFISDTFFGFINLYFPVSPYVSGFYLLFPLLIVFIFWRKIYFKH